VVTSAAGPSVESNRAKGDNPSVSEQVLDTADLNMNKHDSNTLLNESLDSKGMNDGTCLTSLSVDSEIANQNDSCGVGDVPLTGDQGISWGDVISLMLQYMDVSVCVSMLCELYIPEGSIDGSLYQSSITTALKHRQQK
jgi:hypothetical protein